MHYILIAIAANSFLGEFDSLEACQSAIKDRYTATVAASAQSNESVKKAIDVIMKTQREFICVPKRV